MTETQLPPGLVLWPDDGGIRQRIAVLISDIHCTDCSVGNQTANDTDWKQYFSELGEMLDDTITDTSEVLLILNGDVVDLLRSGKWAAADVYPWQRDNPGFETTILSIMHDIVERHARDPLEHPDSTGFFHYLQKTLKYLRSKTQRVTLVPIVGNHDKELQVVPVAREIYYRQCLGLAPDDLSAAYRSWVAALMGGNADEPWPLLPFYFADPSLRLFATHGQWRDNNNCRATPRWKICRGWQPHVWQQEQYRAFSDPCFGDTVASGLLSNYIWNTTQAIRREVIPRALKRAPGDGINHILNVLGEMDLYRPAASAVARLLEEARKLDSRDEDTRLLFKTVVDHYRKSLHSWLDHKETYRAAPLLFKFLLPIVSLLSYLHWTWLDTGLMRLMAWISDQQRNTHYARLPAFLADYRPVGFRLHAEGHTHDAMEIDLRYGSPPMRRNYTYINLGAWRNRIVQKFEKQGYRRRCIGRALIVQGNVNSEAQDCGYGFTLRDITSWGDRLDRW
ncbi:MAG: metallophosphoesterase [Sideroxyarcus sp.]|nr:metallophosphoesterase [Sideroxyarcus sp.]